MKLSSSLSSCLLLVVVHVLVASGGVHGWSASPSEGRRAFLASGAAATVATTTAIVVAVAGGEPAQAASLGSKESVVQREINTFNSLIYNFKNTALDGGLDAKTLTEPSISFVEFGDLMKKGQVTFVEFMAPTGAVAYATLKKSPKRPIRIGQGYPTGGKKSWSSPDFVIRSVSNYGVPYKFTVPALAKYKKK